MARLSISRTMNDGFGVVKDRFGPLAALAGIFQILPGILLGLGFASFQVAAMTAPETILTQLQNGGWIALGAAYLLAMVVQMTGAGALCAACANSSAPGMTDAVRIGLRALPTLIGCLLLLIVGMFAVGLAMVAITGGLAVGSATASGSGAGAGVMLVLLMIVTFIGAIYLMIKYSLTLPAVVVDGIGNPLTAFGRSWRLTKGASFRLFLLYAIMMVIYGVIIQILTSLTLGSVLTNLAGGATPGAGVMTGFVLVTTVAGALFNVVLTAMVTAAHRQLGGPSTGDVAETFA